MYAYQSKQIAENRERSLRELHEKRQEQLLAQQEHRRNMEMEEVAINARRQKSNELRLQLLEQTRARELQLVKDKSEKQDKDDHEQHVCDVDDVISLHPNFRQILSFEQK